MKATWDPTLFEIRQRLAYTRSFLGAAGASRLVPTNSVTVAPPAAANAEAHRFSLPLNICLRKNLLRRSLVIKVQCELCGSSNKDVKRKPGPRQAMVHRSRTLKVRVRLCLQDCVITRKFILLQPTTTTVLYPKCPTWNPHRKKERAQGMKHSASCETNRMGEMENILIRSCTNIISS
jgi:hypothetical protein